MKRHVAALAVLASTLCALPAAAADRPVTDVKELAGTWRGWVNLGSQQNLATMIIKPDGSYEASTQLNGTLTVGNYYLENGKLRYRSTQSTGSATLSENKGKLFLLVIPETGELRTGKTEYERMP